MDRPFDEFIISKTILDSYYNKLRDSLNCDVVIVGAGPSGLLLAGNLASKGFNTVVIEAKLSPGGGTWGGGIGMNEIVFQPEATDLLEKIDLNYKEAGVVVTCDAIEMAASLINYAVKSGAKIFNLLTAEDLCVLGGKVSGVVVNRTGISGKYHVDPIMFTSKVVVDATGHDAKLVNYLVDHGIILETKSGTFMGEGAMDVVEGENFVVKHAGKLYDGLYLTGMAVCATYNGPRMGPIFGGMLFSAEKVTDLIAAEL